MKGWSISISCSSVQAPLVILGKLTSGKEEDEGGLDRRCAFPEISEGGLVWVQKTLNVYATATLSGDVANALALLKRMTRPVLRKQKSGLLIPAKELACCHVNFPHLLVSLTDCVFFCY